MKMILTALLVLPLCGCATSANVSLPIDVEHATHVAFIRASQSASGIALSKPVYWKGDPSDLPPYDIPEHLLPEQLIKSGEAGWLLLYHDEPTCCNPPEMYPVLNGQVNYLTEGNKNQSVPLAEVERRLKD